MEKVTRTRVWVAAVVITLAACATPALAKKPKALSTTAPQPAAATAPAPAPPEKITSVEGITEYRLANGLRVLMFPDPTKQTITVNVTYLVGSRHENYGETGMAHLLEHMVFKGSPRHPDIPAELTSHGSRPNGTTSWDRTNYFETFSATEENLRWALDLESDRMVNSFIAKKDLDTEMTVVRNEYEAGENAPINVLFKRLLATAYDWHNYGNTPIGARSDIEGVPIERLQAFYKTYYQPDNAILLVAGKFDEAATLKLVQEYFGPIPRPTRALPAMHTIEATQDGERQVILRRVGDVQIAAIAYHVPAGSHADFAPLLLLSQVLGDTPSGRLHKNLVETQKAAGIFNAPLQLYDPGLVVFAAQVRSDKPLDPALAGLIADVEKTSAKPITDAEVERARAQILKQIELNLNNADGVGLELSNWAGMGDWRLLFLNRDRLRAVKTADVQRVWSTYFKSSNRTTGLYYPTKQPERVELPAKPDVLALVKDYKGDTAKEDGEAFDPSPANIDARTQRSTLPGGMKLALLPKKTRGAAVVAVLSLHFGDEKSLMNRTDAGGAAAAMLMRGTLKHTREQLEDEFDKLKARVDVSGGAQGANVSIETTRENLPAVLTLVTEVLRQPSFDAKEFEQLRTENLARLEASSKEPQMLAGTAFMRHLNPYPRGDVRYQPTVEEQLADFKALTREQVVQFHKEFYGAQHAELAVIGDFDAAALAAQVQKELGGWKAPKPYARVPDPYLEVAAKEMVIETPDKANAFFISGLAFPLRDDDPDYPALVLGNYMLGGSGLKSRLMARIRIKDGLSYGGNSQIQADEIDKSGGFLSFWIHAPQNRDKVEAAFKEEIARSIGEDFTAQELAEAKSGWIQSRSVGRAQDKELVRALGRKAFFDRTFAWDADLERKVMALDAATIRGALAKYLVPGRFTTVKAGDFAKAASAATPAPTPPATK
jgi:zinc protease